MAPDHASILDLQRLAGNASVHALITGPASLQRQDGDGGDDDEAQWQRFDGDGFINNVQNDLKQFDDFKANPQSGQQIDDIGLDASIKLFTDQLGGLNMYRLFKDIKGLATSKLGEAGVAKINQLRAISNGVKGGWSALKLIFKFPRASWQIVKASVKENFNVAKVKEKMAQKLEPGFGLLKVKIGHDGVRADPTKRYWGPGDLDGPVRSMKFLNAGIATPVGEAEYKGIDALELLGNKGWSENVSFPQLGAGEAKLENQLNAKVEVTLLEVSGGYAVGG